MRRKIVLSLACFLWSLATAYTQLPLRPGSAEEILTQAKLIQQKDYHTAIKPFNLQTNDTFFVRPAFEAHLYTLSETFGYLAAGPELYWKKSHLAIWAAAPGGAARVPSWWHHRTIPFAGEPIISFNDYGLWADPQVVVSYKSKFFTLQAGRSKFHLGEGYNSLWLNDYAPAFPFIGATVQVRHVLYGYQINLLKNPDLRYGGLLEHAFNFTHYFDFNFGPLTINMFETVVQDPIDSLGARRGLDVNYLNPVIFFRAVDLMLGSPDNVLLGLGGSLRVRKKLLLYGYGILDEMLVSHLLAGDKCWCLKYGANAGMKAFFPLGNNLLFVQGELASVRPYTYSHDNPILAYGNLYQPLGHPLGANFYQALLTTSFIKEKKFTVTLTTSFSTYGQDIDSVSYGKDIFRSYLERVGDLGITTAQGDKTSLFYLSLEAGKKITAGLWFKAGIIYSMTTGQQQNNQLLLNFSLSSGLLNPRWDWR